LPLAVTAFTRCLAHFQLFVTSSTDFQHFCWKSKLRGQLLLELGHPCSFLEIISLVDDDFWKIEPQKSNFLAPFFEKSTCVFFPRPAGNFRLCTGIVSGLNG
jgi:hypothetical protein